METQSRVFHPEPLSKGPLGWFLEDSLGTDANAENRREERKASHLGLREWKQPMAHSPHLDFNTSAWPLVQYPASTQITFSAPSSPRPSSVSASKNTSRDREDSRDGSCSTPHPENTILPSQQEESPPSLAGQFPPSLGADCDRTSECWLQGCKWKLVELDLIRLTLTPKWNEEDTPFSWTLVLHMAKFWTQWMLLGQPCWSRRWIWECRPCATKQQGKRTQHSVLHQKHLWERQTSLLCKPLECWISCYL